MAAFLPFFLFFPSGTWLRKKRREKRRKAVLRISCEAEESELTRRGEPRLWFRESDYFMVRGGERMLRLYSFKSRRDRLPFLFLFQGEEERASAGSKGEGEESIQNAVEVGGDGLLLNHCLAVWLELGIIWISSSVRAGGGYFADGQAKSKESGAMEGERVETAGRGRKYAAGRKLSAHCVEVSRMRVQAKRLEFKFKWAVGYSSLEDGRVTSPRGESRSNSRMLDPENASQDGVGLENGPPLGYTVSSARRSEMKGREQTGRRGTKRTKCKMWVFEVLAGIVLSPWSSADLASDKTDMTVGTKELALAGGD
ncbi:hypothetical protein DFH09DRAFT_1079214 [Mycena vulgaris]|nr:hypothetical protein DFH09DRAFT_1079214 [Mycena vulgaris]